MCKFFTRHSSKRKIINARLFSSVQLLCLLGNNCQPKIDNLIVGVTLLFQQSEKKQCYF